MRKTLALFTTWSFRLSKHKQCCLRHCKGKWVKKRGSSNRCYWQPFAMAADVISQGDLMFLTDHWRSLRTLVWGSIPKRSYPAPCQTPFWSSRTALPCLQHRWAWPRGRSTGGRSRAAAPLSIPSPLACTRGKHNEMEVMMQNLMVMCLCVYCPKTCQGCTLAPPMTQHRMKQVGETQNYLLLIES